MDKAEFIVDTNGWKTFYRMSEPTPERLLAFSALVSGTIQSKLADVMPQLSKAASAVNAKEFEVLAKQVASAARKVVKEAGVAKEQSKFAEMWASFQLLQLAGLKVTPEEKELRGILKKL